MNPNAAKPKKRVLLISFYFPPFHKSSGSLRILKFAKYLPENGYDPFILTAHPFAYEKKDDTLLRQLSPSLHVHRTLALDAKRHLSFKGRYPDILALPDRYASWIPLAIASGLLLLHKYDIDLIFSSSPTLSNHVIANALRRLTKKPWVADFRDPAWDEYYLKNNLDSRVRRNIEKATLLNADRVTVTTPGMRNLYKRRYSERLENDIQVIEYGFEYPDFEHVISRNGHITYPVKFLHAGLLDREDRDPLPFFHAVRIYKHHHPNAGKDMQIDLIAPGDEGLYQREIDKLDLTDIVHIKSPLPYDEILQTMADSDVLLLFQGKSCDLQIPAKLYEYLRIGKPVLALTTQQG